MSFVEVIKKYGYPIISKETANAVGLAQRGFPSGIMKLKGLNTDGTENTFRRCFKKYEHLKDADFLIGNDCCRVMKKAPAKHFEKKTGLKPFVGTMAEESPLRKTAWLQKGCNAFDGGRPMSTPLSFWSKQDVLQYILLYGLEYPSVYGDVVEKDGKLVTTGCKRTGCVFCGFGCHLEKEPNRFQQLAITHPKLYDYCLRGGKYDEGGRWIPDKGLGMAKVLDYIGVQWWNTEAEHEKYSGYEKRPLQSEVS